MALGNHQEAVSFLREAEQIAKTIKARRIWWPILAALSQLNAQIGDGDAAESWRSQAQAVVQFISNNSPSDLRRSFLSLAEVTAVLQPS